MKDKKGQLSVIKVFPWLFGFALLLILAYFLQYTFNDYIQHNTTYATDTTKAHSAKFTSNYPLWFDLCFPLLYIVMIISYSILAYRTTSKFLYLLATVLMIIVAFSFLSILPDMWDTISSNATLSARASEMVMTNFMMTYPQPFIALYILIVGIVGYYKRSQNE